MVGPHLSIGCHNLLLFQSEVAWSHNTLISTSRNFIRIKITKKGNMMGDAARRVFFFLVREEFRVNLTPKMVFCVFINNSRDS